MFASFFSSLSIAQPLDTILDEWAYNSLNIPLSNATSLRSSPVIVAVVDDAFRLSHNELKEFVYVNPGELPGNQLDDDGNNHVDDVSGWDISDNDKDVSVYEGREREFYHGTYISSLITRVARLHYGEEASNRIKIMPVKVLSDQASKTYVRDGYKGIRYAIENGADIICLAWSGGDPGAEDLEVLSEAHQKGILIIASAGNFNEERILHPALSSEVLAVAGINMNRQKDKLSNFGMQVDLSAPASLIKGAHPEKDNAYIQDNGTSASAALVVGCAAIIMSKNEGLTNLEIKEALLNTATPFDEYFSTYGGKMGAGTVNLESALDYISDAHDRKGFFTSLRSKGTIIIDAESTKYREINPAGAYHGFYLEPDVSGIKKPEKHSFNIVLNDTVWNTYNMSKYPPQIFVPSSPVSLNVQNTSFRKNDIFRINYHGNTIDSTKLYCSDTRYMNLESSSIDDGSGESNYANNCSCRWIITVPEGKRVKFTFDQMDTQANVDFVYLVDGKTAIPENFIAKFSGQNIPPVVVSRTNEVLVWFVTDKSSTGQGWHFQYETFD